MATMGHPVPLAAADPAHIRFSSANRSSTITAPVSGLLHCYGASKLLVGPSWHRQGSRRLQLGCSGFFSGRRISQCKLQSLALPRHQNRSIMCQMTKVKVKLRLAHQVEFGEEHALFGSAKSMGKWHKKVPMTWTESGWTVDLDVDPSERVEFKYVIVSRDGNLTWEDGPNRTLELPDAGNIEIISEWNNTHEPMSVNKYNVSPGQGQLEQQVAILDEELPVNGDAKDGVESAFVQDWQGRKISFMKSNEHHQERTGKWDTTGLQGSALFIVKGDQESRNWWRKLEVVQNLVTGKLGDTNRLQTLVYISVYLKWINTGQIPCHEDGGHHRPNRHAEISRLIFREMERIYAHNTSAEETAVIRKIHPCLPSFKSEFTASVPLTRIRDIAHRNDIPHDLKQEIKHTIQNKLHRNAGPEDLVATEMLLARVSKNEGEYSSAFVEQLKIFYNELKDFFNASSLTEQLESLEASFDEEQVLAVKTFLSLKKQLDSVQESCQEELYLSQTMAALTDLRFLLLKGLESGLRNDASDEAIAMRQKWRLSEIGLEDYFFVLLSRYINSLEVGGVANNLVHKVSSGDASDWSKPLSAAIVAIRHLRMSHWKPAECLAIENELKAWEAQGIGSKDGVKLWALRLKATLDRARRLADLYTDMFLQLYPQCVEELGGALGIPENTVRTYTEAEIRASVVFQLSKLNSILLKAIRLVLGAEGWDTIMTGKVSGKLLEINRIVPGSLPTSSDGPVLLLVKEADGDEEVRAAGPNVAGVILQHELPHLSHLGVRARQEKVLFVTCDNEEKIENLRSLVGRKISLEATPEGVTFSEANTSENTSEVADSNNLPATSNTSAPTSFPAVLSSGDRLLQLQEAVTEKAGAKAAACGKLAVLSNLSMKEKNKLGIPAAFDVPQGRVIPFGAMEAALEASGNAMHFKDLLERIEIAQVEKGELDNACNELRALVSSLRPPKILIDSISDSFVKSAKLIVRSSANVEDLAGMSGAGLYESIANVKASDPASFGKAIAEVWASLYTRRAALSRRVAGVPQRFATMAILVQELLFPDLSFVLHTVNPTDRNEDVVQAEIAAGLGETLASGTRGAPWRLKVSKSSGNVEVQAFANFSEELRVEIDGAADGSLSKTTVDYSKKLLSNSLDYHKELGQKLGAVGEFLEVQFGCPQDVEGCVVGNNIFIVQARPQP